MKISFNVPYLTGKEKDYISEVFLQRKYSGDGEFTFKCRQWFENTLPCSKALLTHSCTAALEMAALLSELQPGDEVIMPSYTFVSTANAFVLRGAIPVFVDIRADTLNINENLIEAAITAKTKAIVVVHYAGVVCEMDEIKAIAQKYNLILIEDAAQAILSQYKNQYAGTFGTMSAFSFHETKNINSGEGGMLVLNSPSLIERAEIIREKGTNRSRYFRGQVDKYTWVDVGSSYLPSELIAAFLYAQLEEAEKINEKRMGIWEKYHEAFAKLESEGKIRRPIIPAYIKHNAHMYYILLSSFEMRAKVIETLKSYDILSVFHYVPLHSAPAGKLLGKTSGTLEITDKVADTLLRLPMWIGLEEHLDYVIEKTILAINENY